MLKAKSLQAAKIRRPLTFVQPVFHVHLPGVDGLAGLAAHVVDVAAELPGPAQVDRGAHGQLLQAPALLRQSDGLRVFLRGTRRMIREDPQGRFFTPSPHAESGSVRFIVICMNPRMRFAK